MTKLYSIRRGFHAALIAGLLLNTSCGAPLDSEAGSELKGGCNSVAVPAMTSATLPSGRVTQSGVYSTAYDGWKAFDSSDSSMWISAVNQNPAWIGYEFSGGAQRVTSYNLKFVNGSLTSRAPKNWTLQAYNGASWVVVDTRSNQTNWAGVEERSFNVQNPGNYSRYRLNFTDDNDARAGVVVISLGKITLVADSCNWNELYKDWHRDSSLSSATVDHYVPASVPVPVARFVPAMKFRADGSYHKLMLSPNDGHYFASGTFTRNDNAVHTVVNDPRLGTVVQDFTILSLSAGALRIQR